MCFNCVLYLLTNSDVKDPSNVFIARQYRFPTFWTLCPIVIMVTIKFSQISK